MFQILLVAFLAIPVIEIYLLIQVGSVIGAGWTIFIVIGTAILGASLLRQQGLETWSRLTQSIAQGQLPPTMLVEGILLLLSGAFLLTPGFFTDSIGFLFLIPLVRKALAGYLLSKGLFMAAGMHSSAYSSTSSSRSHTTEYNVIEGEYEERKDHD
ncbi:MAG: FxsA family protein [Gammaproteobacteria bacterium]|nr:FxsA family protein [Gammaproteobacteria bacterium]